MPILNPIHALPGSQVLNQLIEQYNLLPHDKKAARSSALEQIVQQTLLQNTTPNPKLITWMVEPSGLQDHLAYYQVKNSLSTIRKNFKTDYVNQITDVKSPHDDDTPSVKP